MELRSEVALSRVELQLLHPLSLIICVIKNSNCDLFEGFMKGFYNRVSLVGIGK
jgi:hypothetical protein